MIFSRSGIGRRSDLSSDQWRSIFKELEVFQNHFFSVSDSLISEDYIWRGDPLHSWSRVWEYPYVFANALELIRTVDGELPTLVDLGSGITFFPFVLAAQGFNVICIDIDPSFGESINEISKVIGLKKGSVNFRYTDGVNLPLDDAEVDAIFSVSVLEHVEHRDLLIAEIARILKPQGHFLLTFDLDLRGNREISPEQYRLIKEQLNVLFEYYQRDETIHPADILTSENSIYRVMPPSGIALTKLQAKNLIRPLLGRNVQPLVPYYLAVEGMSLVKR